MDVAAVRLAEHDWSAQQVSKEKQVPSSDRRGVNVIEHCFCLFWPFFWAIFGAFLEKRCFDYFISVQITFCE
jgi:hypothetical protein